ncbi:MAG: hypothetical protein RIR97_779 [Pseudomonadota bacterium]
MMESNLTFDFEAELWIYPAAKAAWHFVTVPDEVSRQIRFFAPSKSPGFGSVPVIASVNGFEWKTSVFPDQSKGCCILPVKTAARKAGNLQAGTLASFQLKLLAL